MAESDQTESSPSVQIANQFIDMANTHIQNGSDVQDIASGLRHAAANFSAYAFFRDDQMPKDPNTAVDDDAVGRDQLAKIGNRFAMMLAERCFEGVGEKATRRAKLNQLFHGTSTRAFRR